MDPKEKTKNGTGTTDEIDLEPLDLDFDLELPSLDEESSSDQEFSLPELPEIDEEQSEAPPTLPGGEEEGPITLTADELNDIVSADLTGAGPAREQPAESSAGDDSDLILPDFDSGDIAFSADEDLVSLGTEPEDETMGSILGGSEELDLEPTADGDLLDLDLTQDLSSSFGADETVAPGELNLAPEPIDIDLDLEGEAPIASARPRPETDGMAAGDTGDELVALSEDELDSILGDIDEEGIPAESEEHDGSDDLAADLEDLPEGDVAPIGMSEEELQEEVIGEDSPRSVSILDADEDESITLTMDELSNIVSEEAIPAEEAGEEMEFGTEGGAAFMPPVPSSESSFFRDDEEEGPVALTDDELAGILEGTTIEEEEGGIAEPPRSERMAEELSMETGLKRDELKRIIGYLDDLLGQLPEETVREFSRSEYFNLYKKVIEDLGIYQ